MPCPNYCVYDILMQMEALKRERQALAANRPAAMRSAMRSAMDICTVPAAMRSADSGHGNICTHYVCAAASGGQDVQM